MVRTRGLRRVLSRVLGRALNRQVVDDEEEAPSTLKVDNISNIDKGNCFLFLSEHVDHDANKVHEKP